MGPDHAGRIGPAAWPVTAVFILSNAPTPLYVLWRDELGFSAGTLTVIFASYIAGLLGTLLVAGRASDRLGRKPVLVPGLTLGVLACVIFATASSVLALALARLLTGIAVGVIVSAGMAAVVDVGGPARARPAALAASTAMVIGAGSGPLLAGLLSVTLAGPTVTVFLMEIVLLVSALAVVWRLPLRRPTGGPTGSWIRLPTVPAGYGSHVLAGIAVFAPGITATSFVLSLGPSLLADLLDTHSRLIVGAMAFVMFAAATGAQVVARRHGPRAMLLSGAACTIACMALLILAVHLALTAALVAAAILAGAGQGLGQLGGLTLISTHVPAGHRAEANAALSFGGYIPAGLLPVAAGYLGDATGLATSATVFALVTMAAALVAAAIVQGGREHLSRARAIS